MASNSEIITAAAALAGIDKDGRTASQAAAAIFKVGGFAVQDWYNTTRERLVKVEGITKTGRVKVQRIDITAGVNPVTKIIPGTNRPVYDQEHSIVNLEKLRHKETGEMRQFIPRLFDGEWRWWNDRETLTPLVKNRLTWLLD